jgi:hypothetical protein
MIYIWPGNNSTKSAGIYSFTSPFTKIYSKITDHAISLNGFQSNISMISFDVKIQKLNVNSADLTITIFFLTKITILQFSLLIISDNVLSPCM